MKDFYPTQVQSRGPNVGIVRFLDVKERGKPCEEFYDLSAVNGTKEEFTEWAKWEFGYLRIEIILC